jgi:hypothetical protein
MAYKRFKVKNYDRWGLLIKTWATGRNYIGGEKDDPAPPEYSQLPSTPAEFINVLNLAGVNPTDIDVLTEISYVRVHGPGHLVIRLASNEMISNSEADLIAKPNYGLPEFYRSMFVGEPAEAPLGNDDKMKFHASRIGDYTLSICQ